MRPLPFALFLLFFAVTFVGRSLLAWAQTGHNPYVLPRGGSAEAYVGTAFRVTLVALLAALALHACDADSALGTLPWANTSWTLRLGLALGLAALAWVSVAQWQMGTSWRIGIDREHGTALITHGVFGWSRNPIFLGMRTALLAAVLMVPNGLVLAAAVAGELLMQLQVRLEEAFLIQRHGPIYQTYATKVPRWLALRKKA